MTNPKDEILEKIREIRDANTKAEVYAAADRIEQILKEWKETLRPAPSLSPPQP